ncbi:hypothetical protein CRE_15638 [Caenorhabditis remanei]|uniref:Uncharacterized protein n=1 Tax=Caenorhabditis remanei TaxID=31234 RepID=E3N834_CAERE|nr:hypothetical protein CRE_15638 [Caenorhabditis remanei]
MLCLSNKRMPFLDLKDSVFRFKLSLRTSFRHNHSGCICFWYD